ncbi:MAG: hypothetical protein FJY67_11725 [Calditrichaeota bacterium]|nr:hypothetical protein [Calditrichota bacterium]
MKSRTLTLIIAAVMLIAVGVLVWPEPEEARADVQYHITVYVWDGDSWEYMEGGWSCWFTFDPEGTFEEETDCTSGTAHHSLNLWSANPWIATSPTAGDDRWEFYEGSWCVPDQDQPVALRQHSLEIPAGNTAKFFLRMLEGR